MVFISFPSLLREKVSRKWRNLEKVTENPLAR